MKAIAARKKKENDLMFEGKRIRLEAIPLNTQKFKMLKINKIILMDSMGFLSDSLENLVENLKKSNHAFNLMRQWVDDPDQLQLLLRKGIFPYEHMDSMDKLHEKVLPPPEAFASRLSGSASASQEDYEHAQKVWKTFGCNDMKEYSLLYVMADCYQLLEAMCELRFTLYNEFNLDLCHFFSLPMYAKCALFKKTGAKVELLTDSEMIHMVKSNIR